MFKWDVVLDGVRCCYANYLACMFPTNHIRKLLLTQEVTFLCVPNYR